MTRDAEGFDPKVPLPPGLTIGQVRSAIDVLEGAAVDFLDLYYEQANIFSAVVGILGIRALDAASVYRRHKHPDVAQQRFPDLSYKGKLNPPPLRALESKGSMRPWPIQSHYDHPGWYVIWRYVVDSTKQMKPGRPVVIWRVDIPFLRKEDWKFEGSKARKGRGGRTHTFGVTEPKSKILPAIVYTSPRCRLVGGKPTLATTDD